MIEQVFPDIYRIKIPLPDNPLRATNSYLIRGQKRNLLVDTGFNREESRKAMDQALQELDVNLESTDLFITHLHSDHAGLVQRLATDNSTVWMSETDARVVGASRGSSHWTIFSEFLHKSGLIAMGVEDVVAKHPGYRFASEVFDNFTLVEDGDEIKVGDFCFRCVQTPGHTRGHMCLYEPGKKLLFSGDHILGKITPNITLWQINEDVLGSYLESLDKIAELDVNMVFPGHRYILHDCRGRIQELKAHHDRRLDDIIKILGQETMSGAEVASQMRWDLSYKTWDEFPWGQKLFATGEAVSHLYHLTVMGRLSMLTREGIIYFKQS